MKRILSILFAALILITCASACAETIRYEEYGFSLDFSGIEEKSGNYPFLMEYGVLQTDPFVSGMKVGYINMPRNVLDTIEGIISDTEDEAEYNDYSDLVHAVSAPIASIIVTDAKTLEAVDLDESFLSRCEVTEFGTLGDYHYYYFAYPLDGMFPIYDEAEDTGDYEVPPQEMKAAALTDIRMIQAELKKELQAAELFEPVNPTEKFIGQKIEFESVDPDGNAVNSADLFKDNRITMVNLWGTWCVNCLNEMGELADMHRRLQEKGCGIVGVEFEQEPIEAVADLARQIFEENNITYPNVWMPEGNPVFEQVNNFPFTFFVDSEGRIITYPIRGAAVDDYEPIIEKLLSGEIPAELPDTGATANEDGEYRVIVYDTEGNPVKGVIVQLCDDTTCSFQKTNADGVATFQVETPKVYDVHVGKVPEGYLNSDETYKTLDVFSDVNIFLEKAA